MSESITPKPDQMYTQLQFEDLYFDPNKRDLRQSVVDEIVNEVKEGEYNPASLMRVFEADDRDGYVVVDGNHRLKALEQIGVSPDYTIPCLIEPESADRDRVRIKSNRIESVYAERDLFDELDDIARWREDGLTQAQMAEKLGKDWSRDRVAKHVKLLNNTVTEIRELAKRHDSRRVTEDVTGVTFTEYWFRDSGLYELNPEGTTEYAKSGEDEAKHAQVRVMEWFCEEQDCDATKNAVQNKVKEVLEKLELLDILNERLEPGVSDEKREELRQQVIQGVYTKDTIDSPIENANKDAKDRAIYGEDARDILPNIESDSVDCVVTDPPYGIDFSNVRPTDNPEFDDSGKNAFEVINDVLQEVQRVCKANAHIYIFFSMSEYERVKDLAEQYFEVVDTPLIWAKNNHTPKAPGNGGFEKGYAQKYEPVLYCQMEKGDQRTLNGGVSPNVLEHSRPTDKIHQTQKPRSLLKELIENSTGKGERVLDPYAGSGSTLLAAKEVGRHYVGVELNDDYENKFHRALNEVEQRE